MSRFSKRHDLVRVALFVVCTLLGVIPALAHGQTVDSGDGAPQLTEANAATEAEYQRALEAARAELAEVKERIRTEAEAFDAKIAAASTAVAELADEESGLRVELDAGVDRDFELAAQLQEAELEVKNWSNQIEALWSELRTQALDTTERFEGSVFEAEEPDLCAAIRPLGTASSDVPDSIRNDLEALLAVYRRVIDAASNASRFRGPVQLTFQNGRIEEADVLRLGLLANFYSHDATGEAGFVSASPESEGKLVGRAVGLSESQMNALDGFIAAPTEGALIPFDVTGGAGLASLQAADNITTWFEKGGKFMWPLLIVACLAALIILERAIALTIRTRGIDAKIRKLLALVDAGRIEEAEAKADQMGGAVGRVFHAALVHRDQERSVMEDAVQEALLHETPSFQKRLAFVALCAAVAPLMGLLGTVTGMITTFKMVTIFGTSDPRFMAGGISEALITTQGGLYLAIPCLLCRGILGSMADGALGRLETGAMSAMLVTLKHQEAERARGASDDADESADPSAEELSEADPLELDDDAEDQDGVPLPISERMSDRDSLPEPGVGTPGVR